MRRLNDLADRVRSTSSLVVYVQHEGPPGDPHHPGAWGWPLLPSLRVRDSDRISRKTFCDAFLSTDLDHVLKGAGCATDFCVDTTIRSALAHGYKTVVPVDGHTTADRPHLSASKIIEHHNAVWADFMSPAGAATLVRCAEVGL